LGGVGAVSTAWEGLSREKRMTRSKTNFIRRCRRGIIILLLWVDCFFLPLLTRTFESLYSRFDYDGVKFTAKIEEEPE
jgi:hypothetical protein